MSTARATAIQPRETRVKPSRPELRVVTESRRSRRPSPGRVGTITGITLFVALFALAGFQTVLINGQGHLDEVNKRIDTAEAKGKDLDLAAATLQSPERITTEARDRLGMIQLAGAVYLQPSPDDAARAGEVPVDAAPTTTVPRPTTPSTTTAPSAQKATPPTTAKSSAPTTSPTTVPKSSTPKTTSPPTTAPSQKAGRTR